jgi:putative flavoprotein involved in K+ transport
MSRPGLPHLRGSVFRGSVFRGYGIKHPKDPGPWEGELRNMCKPTQVPHLWVQAGNLHQNRHYSQFMGLQLKARYEGLETPVYGLEPVHHKS